MHLTPLRRPKVTLVLLMATLAVISFVYGVLTVDQGIFPYAQLKHLRDRARAGLNPTAAGADIFQAQCAGCHGGDGGGGNRGPSLRLLTLNHGNSDASLDPVIRNGISGTDMPGTPLSAGELIQVIAYVQSLSETVTAAPPPGEASEGQRVYSDLGCESCHRLGGEGESVGPDLSRIGAQRSVASLRRAVLEPNAEITAGYSSIELRDRRGDVVRGILLNEDNHSVQLLDLEGRLRSFWKVDLAMSEVSDSSMMPSYRNALGDEELVHLLAYLASLDGAQRGVTVAERGNTISTTAGSVPGTRLLEAETEPENWLTYSGTYTGQRFSQLDEINASTVADLGLRWVYQLQTSDKVEATPIIADGVMYVTGPGGSVHAIDAKTGRAFWQYEPTLPQHLPLCCGRPNRGVAVLGDAVYVGRLDGRLVALDANTGNELWMAEVADPAEGYSITAAPLAVKDMIVIGVSGGEFGIRGFLDAYDARTGKRRWRFYTIPGPDEPGNETWSGKSWKTGGGPTWVTGSYDSETDLIFWGVGNPDPPLFGESRDGDNLYTNAVVALDADDGQLRWFYQFTPHDTHDWDANQTPVLIDAVFEGQPRKLMLWANRNGFFYVLDRRTGEFLLARAFALQDWAEGFDSIGRPIVRPGSATSVEGTIAAPGEGGTNWYPPTFSPVTGLFYVLAFDSRGITYTTESEVVQGRFFMGGYGQLIQDDGAPVRAAIRALNGLTGELVWEFPFDYQAPVAPLGQSHLPASSGLLSTAGGLVFGGSNRGSFFALDATSGEQLWHVTLGGPINAPPVTYISDGKQLITVAAGASFYTFELR